MEIFNENYDMRELMIAVFLGIVAIVNCCLLFALKVVPVIVAKGK